MLRETKAGVGAQEGAGKAEQGCLFRRNWNGFNKPSRARMVCCGHGAMLCSGRWCFRVGEPLLTTPCGALPRGLRGQQKKPKHPSLQRWFWKAKLIITTFPQPIFLPLPRSPPMLSNL